MRALPPGFLAKKGRRWRPVRLCDVVTLLYNIHAGAQDQDIGFEDADRTMESITARLNKTILLDPGVLESALWSCSMMNEKNKFWELKGRVFEQFVKDIMGRDSLHSVYHTIQEK